MDEKCKFLNLEDILQPLKSPYPNFGNHCFRLMKTKKWIELQDYASIFAVLWCNIPLPNLFHDHLSPWLKTTGLQKCLNNSNSQKAWEKFS